MSAEGRAAIPWSWGWGAIVLAFPWSNAFMSVATGLLALTALSRWRAARAVEPSRPLVMGALALTVLMAWTLLSSLWSNDTAAAINDFRIKLPLLVGALVLWRMAVEDRNMKGGETVLKLAVGSALLATLVVVAGDIVDGGQLGGRQSSRFISHIRFGLWWAVLLPLVVNVLGPKWNWLCLAGAVLTWTWTQSVSGLVLGICTAPWWWTPMWRNRSTASMHRPHWPEAGTINRLAVRLSVASLAVLAVLFAGLPTALPDAASLPERSRKGERYVHNVERSVTENGHHVWTMLAWGELQQGWQARSEIPYDTIDGALVRFLASKGLPKDEEGLAALSQEEIEAVERHVTSVVELEGGGWAKRWNRFKFNWGQWWDGDRSPNASVLARSVYSGMAIEALRSMSFTQWCSGYGAGQVEEVLSVEYVEHEPDWPASGRKRPHNQYLTLLLSLGCVGLLAWLITMGALWSLRTLRPGVLVLAVSCLTEDTLETQAGVTLVLFALAFGAFLVKPSAWPQA